jgi:paraquat-inducible protein A
MEEVVCCRTCGLAQKVELPESAAGSVALCPRCGSVVSEHKVSSVIPTTALSLAALALYAPANLYPILHMERYGLVSDTTVWEGVAELMRQGYWFVALIVFLASIVQPLFKLALVRLGALATVTPGPGLGAFTGVVVFTILASALFDPKLIWQSRYDQARTVAA